MTYNNNNVNSGTLTYNNNNVNTGTLTNNNNNVSTSTSTNNNVQSGSMTNNNNNVSTSTNHNINSGTMTYNNNNVNSSTNVNTNNNVQSGSMTNNNNNVNTSSSVNTNNNVPSGSMTNNNNNVSASTATNVNQNNNTSTATNVNQNVNSGDMTNRNINTSDITQRVIQPPPTAVAPAMMSGGNADLCTTGTSGSVQTQIFGVSTGGVIRDENCERLKLSKTLYDMGMKVAAVATMCQDRRVFDAMLAAGTPCPYEGKIGEAAKIAWESNPNKVPEVIKEKTDDTYKKIGLGALLGTFVRSAFKF
jgi:hypothetical protein